MNFTNYNAYRKYLYLNAKRLQQGKPLVAASLAIDLYWHAHMMHVQEYHDDCKKLFGSMLDHANSEHFTVEQELQANEEWKQEFGNSMFDDHLREKGVWDKY